jgi:hypothetical protein
VRRLIFILAIVALLLLIASVAKAVNVVVVDTPTYSGTLKVEALPARPELKVAPGESIVNTNGSVNWQPAGSLN